uniref:Ion_trans domain-containing protein n=1 Tax=Panagrellus redivivus TaxID=6233 RepID=A0A7E4V1H6_PANRE
MSCSTVTASSSSTAGPQAAVSSARSQRRWFSLLEGTQEDSSTEEDDDPTIVYRPRPPLTAATVGRPTSPRPGSRASADAATDQSGKRPSLHSLQEQMRRKGSIVLRKLSLAVEPPLGCNPVSNGPVGVGRHFRKLSLQVANGIQELLDENDGRSCQELDIIARRYRQTLVTMFVVLVLSFPKATYHKACMAFVWLVWSVVRIYVAIIEMESSPLNLFTRGLHFVCAFGLSLAVFAD